MLTCVGVPVGIYHPPDAPSLFASWSAGAVRVFVHRLLHRWRKATFALQAPSEAPGARAALRGLSAMAARR